MLEKQIDSWMIPIEQEIEAKRSMTSQSGNQAKLD